MPELLSTIVQRTPATPGLRALLAITTRAQQDMIEHLWASEIFDVLQVNVDAEGVRLPSSGHVAAARLGWRTSYANGVYAPSRVDRMVAHRVISTLRTLNTRDRALTHGEGTAAYVRGAQRQRERFMRANPDVQAEDLRLCDIQPAPNLRPLVNLGAVDRQFATIKLDNAQIVLRLRLPTSERPASRADWIWHTLTFAMPEHLSGRALASVSLPTITLDGDVAVFRFCVIEMVPEPVEASAASTVLGIDWSPSCLAVASVVERRPDGLSSAYEGHRYDDRGLGVKNDRLRTETQAVYAKADRLSALATNAPANVRARLLGEVERLHEHGRTLGAKRRRINRELAFHAARTLVDHALETGASIIALEDLSTYESGGRGRIVNTATSQSARAQAAAALRHTGARAGIDVIDVPARGTSARCPGCDSELARPGGYHSGECSSCSLTGNRDALAAVNIAKRVLTAPESVKVRRDKTKRVTKVAHEPVTRVRDKNRPTPKRPKHKRVRRSVEIMLPSTPAPKRRRGSRPSSRAFAPDGTRVRSSSRVRRIRKRVPPGAGVG